MLWWVACPAALAAAAFLTCGWRGLAFAVGQAVVRCGGCQAGVQAWPSAVTIAAARCCFFKDPTHHRRACCSVLMLETVNYIEHYGLQRRRLPDGRCAPGDGWPPRTLFFCQRCELTPVPRPLRPPPPACLRRYERCGPQHSWNTSFMFTNAVTFRCFFVRAEAEAEAGGFGVRRARVARASCPWPSRPTPCCRRAAQAAAPRGPPPARLQALPPAARLARVPAAALLLPGARRAAQALGAGAGVH